MLFPTNYVRYILLSLVSLILGVGTFHAQAAGLRTTPPVGESRTVSGVILTEKNEVVPGATVTVETLSGNQQITTDGQGRFSVAVPRAR